MPPGRDEGGPSRSLPSTTTAAAAATAVASRGNNGNAAAAPAATAAATGRKRPPSNPHAPFSSRTPIEEGVDGAIARKLFGDGTSALPSLRLSLRATASHTKAGFDSVDQARLAARVATALNGIIGGGGEGGRFVGTAFRVKKRTSRPNPANGRVETCHYGVGVPCSPEEAKQLSSHIQAAGGLAIDLGDGQRGSLMVFLGDDPAEAHHLLQITADSWGLVADSSQAAEGLFDFLKAKGGATMGVQWVAKVQPGAADTWEILSSYSAEGSPSPTLSSIPSSLLRTPASAVHFLALVTGGHEFTCKVQQAGGMNLSDKTPRTSASLCGSPRSARIQISRLFPTLSPRKRAEQPPPLASRAAPGSFVAAVSGQGIPSTQAAAVPLTTTTAPQAVEDEDQAPADAPTVLATTTTTTTASEDGRADLAKAASTPASMDERSSAGTEKRVRSPSPSPVDRESRFRQAPPPTQEDLELQQGLAKARSARREAEKATKAAEVAAKAAEAAAAKAEAQAREEAAAAVAEAERMAAVAAAAEAKHRAEERRQSGRQLNRMEKEKAKKDQQRQAALAMAERQGKVTKPNKSKKEKLSNIPEGLEEEAEEAAGLMPGVTREPEDGEGGGREVTGTGMPTDRHDGPQ